MSLQEEVTTDNDISEAPAVSNNNNSALYDRKHQSKAIRVLTVLAYVLSVSLAAIFLSIYYIFVWDGHPTLAVKSLSKPPTAPGGVQNQEVSTSAGTLPDPTQNFSQRDAAEDSPSQTSRRNGRRYRYVNMSEAFEGNTTESLLVSTLADNYTSVMDEQMGLPESTMEPEDSTPFTTASTEENSTWFPESDDYNSEISEFNKRSIFMQKLFSHQNMIAQ